MSLDTWLAFVAASMLLLLIPGPTVLLVLSYAISHGRRVAASTAAGVAVGDAVAMTASLAGLGALVLASATLFVALKWIGAAYLVWLGVKMLRAVPNSGLSLPNTHDATARHTFTRAATVTALNPKSIAFFIAFVPQFLQPASPLLPQFAILIATFVTLATLNALAYALLAGAMRDRLATPGVITWLTRAGGATLIGMGIVTASMRRAV